MFFAFWALVLLLVLGAGGLVSAQAPPPASATDRAARVAVLVSTQGGAPEARVREFSTHVERAARVAGFELVDDIGAWAERRVVALGALPAARVEAFRQVERLLVGARANTAGLMEDRALAQLSEAARIAESHADVPGAAAWIAEVQTALGISAAQAGLTSLADDAFARAATLDPSRGVRGAEAPPAVVERAAQILAAVARRPRGSFEVRAEVPGARVFLDDREVGELPQIVRAPVGKHVLRVTAPGWSPFGQVLDVLEGRRPPVRVALAPDPITIAAQRLAGAAESFDVVGAAASREALALGAVWLLRIGGGSEDRALLARCDAEGCERPRRLALEQVPFVLSRITVSEPLAILAAEDDDERWLAEQIPLPPPPPPVPFYRRWYVWAGAGAVLAGVIAAIAAASRPAPTQVYQVEVFPPVD